MRAEYKSNSLLIDLNLNKLEEARLRGYKNANLASSKPQFAIDKIETKEWQASLNDTYLQYRILSAKDSNYTLRESVSKYLTNPEKSWVEQINIDQLDVNQKTELRQGLMETEKDLARQDAQMAKEAIQNKQAEFNQEVDIVKVEYKEKGYVTDQVQTAELVPSKPENVNDLNEQTTTNEINTATNDISAEASVIPTAKGTVVEPGTATNETIVEATIPQIAEATLVDSIDQSPSNPSVVPDLPKENHSAPTPKPSSSSEKSENLLNEPAKPTSKPINDSEYRSFLDTYFSSRLEPAPNTGKKAEKDEATTSTSTSSLKLKPPSPNDT